MSIVAGVLASLALAVFINSDLGPHWSSPLRLGSAVVLLGAAVADAMSLSVEDAALVILLALPALAALVWIISGVLEILASGLRKGLQPRISPALQVHRAALREEYFRELVGDSAPSALHTKPSSPETPNEPGNIEEELRELLNEQLGADQSAAVHEDLPAFETPWWITLDVAPDAPMESIVASYRGKLKQYHPDRVNGLAPELVQLAEERTKELNRALEDAKREAAVPA
jgi:hypothetical protein